MFFFAPRILEIKKRKEKHVNLSKTLLSVFFFVFFAAAVSAQNPSGDTPADTGQPPESLSLEKKVQLVLDYMEIQNVMAKHVYYYNAQKQYEELDDIWSKAPDITYGHNGGFKVGQESVRNYYGGMNDRQRKKKLEIMSRLHPEVENVKENEGIGDLVMMPVQTPCIEVAGDGKTAKGVWFSHGMNFEVGADGKPVAYSFWGKIGVDFIKEDGKWKIWHLVGYGDVMWRRDQNWVDSINPPLERTVDEGEFWDKAKKPPYQTYSPTTLPQYDPKPPEPYETWDESLSYVK
jgi:hypothetical protein